MAKKFITVKIHTELHKKCRDTLRKARNKYGEELTLTGWISKTIEAGLAVFGKKK